MSKDEERASPSREEVQFSIKFLTEISGKAKHDFNVGMAASQHYVLSQGERRQEAVVIAPSREEV